MKIFIRYAYLTLRQAKRLVIAVIGATLLLLGVIMLVTPGPGLAGIAIGLALLGLEFAWARRLLRRVKVEMRLAKRRIASRPKAARPSPPAESQTIP